MCIKTRVKELGLNIFNANAYRTRIMYVRSLQTNRIVPEKNYEIFIFYIGMTCIYSALMRNTSILNDTCNV